MPMAPRGGPCRPETRIFPEISAANCVKILKKCALRAPRTITLSCYLASYQVSLTVQPKLRGRWSCLDVLPMQLRPLRPLRSLYGTLWPRPEA